MKNKYLNASRIILGVFFLFVAIIGAVGMLESMFDLNLIKDSHRQFNAAGHYNVNGYAPSLAPIYYSACLIVGSWLLYGEKK